MIRRAESAIRHWPRVACACVTLALLLPAAFDTAPGRGAQGVDWPAASEAPPDVACASANPPFRLGDAARPLGWSTAIGDFNVDGAADVAVADRISRSANGYSYRIQFSISGQTPDDVTFESAQDAITLGVSDVDADSDLDVIASAVLSKDIVGVWLNDGHGRFTSSDVRHLPAAIGARQTLERCGPGRRALAVPSFPSPYGWPFFRSVPRSPACCVPRSYRRVHRAVRPEPSRTPSTATTSSDTK
jgi:hypothetical protein